MKPLSGLAITASFAAMLTIYALLALLLLCRSAAADEDACAARACLESPYGPGMAPACDGRIEALQRAVVRRQGLPVCAEPAGRDFSSGWYWRAMGWERCPTATTADDPSACGVHQAESLPTLIRFRPGAARIAAAGEEALEAVIDALAAGDGERLARVVGVSHSRRDRASEALAAERAGIVRARIAAAGVDASRLRVESRAENWVVSRPLAHGAWVSVVGRGVNPRRTPTGEPVPSAPECGLVAIAAGPLRPAVAAALDRCGYRIRKWLRNADGDDFDYLEDRELAHRAGRSVEELLAWLAAAYGMDGVIDDHEIDFDLLR